MSNLARLAFEYSSFVAKSFVGLLCFVWSWSLSVKSTMFCSSTLFFCVIHFIDSSHSLLFVQPLLPPTPGSPLPSSTPSANSRLGPLFFPFTLFSFRFCHFIAWFTFLATAIWFELFVNVLICVESWLFGDEKVILNSGRVRERAQFGMEVK